MTQLIRLKVGQHFFSHTGLQSKASWVINEYYNKKYVNLTDTSMRGLPINEPRHEKTMGGGLTYHQVGLLTV